MVKLLNTLSVFRINHKTTISLSPRSQTRTNFHSKFRATIRLNFLSRPRITVSLCFRVSLGIKSQLKIRPSTPNLRINLKDFVNPFRSNNSSRSLMSKDSCRHNRTHSCKPSSHLSQINLSLGSTSQPPSTVRSLRTASPF